MIDRGKKNFARKNRLDIYRKNKSNRKSWNAQINRINSLVHLFDDTYEVYKVEYLMILKNQEFY